MDPSKDKKTDALLSLSIEYVPIHDDMMKATVKYKYAHTLSLN